MSTNTGVNAPTVKQLRYLRSLARRKGRTFATPTTTAEASRQIELLLRAPRETFTRRIEENTPPPAAYGTAVREHEIAGRGSSTRWAHKPQTDPEQPRHALGA